MSSGIVANAFVVINAPVARVWAALITPATITRYMVGAEVAADWREGGRISWQGDYRGTPYRDHGTILTFTPDQELQYSHFSPASGKTDVPANYDIVTLKLSADSPTATTLRLTQDANPTEEARAHTAAFWQGMLLSLKGLVEAPAPAV